MKERLSDLIRLQVGDLMNVNVDGIAEQLSSVPEAKMSVSFSFKLTLINGRIYSTGGIGYARRYKDEVEGSVEIPDPKQPKLGLE